MYGPNIRSPWNLKDCCAILWQQFSCLRKQKWKFSWLKCRRTNKIWRANDVDKTQNVDNRIEYSIHFFLWLQKLRWKDEDSSILIYQYKFIILWKKIYIIIEYFFIYCVQGLSLYLAQQMMPSKVFLLGPERPPLTRQYWPRSSNSMSYQAKLNQKACRMNFWFLQ